MRNYVKLRVQRYHINITDPTNPPFNLDTDLTGVGGTDDELKAYEQTQIDGLTAGFPPPYVITVTYPFVPQDAFMLLDKNTIIRVAQSIDASIWDSLSLPPDQQFFRVVNETPRYTGWTDNVGEKRSAAPSDKRSQKADFSGASGLVQAFLALTAYEQALRDSGDLRDAGIVKFAIDSVNNQSFTITDAFDYLRENNLA